MGRTLRCVAVAALGFAGRDMVSRSKAGYIRGGRKREGLRTSPRRERAE